MRPTMMMSLGMVVAGTVVAGAQEPIVWPPGHAPGVGEEVEAPQEPLVDKDLAAFMESSEEDLAEISKRLETMLGGAAAPPTEGEAVDELGIGGGPRSTMAWPEDRIQVNVESEAFPYQEFDLADGPAVLQCLPGYACSVELEPGERETARAIGDSERWFDGFETSARDGVPVRVYVALPSAFGIRTNVLIFTDRRTYTLVLESGGEKSSHADVTVRSRFTYPGKWLMQSEPKAMEPPGLDVPVERPTLGEGTDEEAGEERVDPGVINTDFRATRGRLRYPGSIPSMYDDGEFTYVVFPKGEPIPAINGLGASGGRFPLNERWAESDRAGWFEIPRLVRKVELRLGGRVLRLEATDD